MRRYLSRAALAVALVSALVATRTLRLSAFGLNEKAKRYEDLYFLPNHAWLPVLSLGFRQALADLLWCRTLVYFGEEVSQRGEVRFLFEYADAILELDPDFKAVYRWIGTAALYRPQGATFESGLRAAEYLDRAVRRWPEDGDMHWEYGSLLRFELAPIDKDPVHKRSLLARAAPHLTEAARLGAGPPWLGLSNVAMFNKLGQADRAIRSLEEIYPTITDPEARKEVEQRIAALRSQTFAEVMEAAHAQFTDEHRATYPYLSPTLYLLLRPATPLPPYSTWLADRFVAPATAEEGPLSDTPPP